MTGDCLDVRPEVLSPSGISWLGLLTLLAVFAGYLFWKMMRLEKDLKDTKARLASQLDVPDYQALCHNYFVSKIVPDLDAHVADLVRDGVQAYLPQEESQCDADVCIPVFVSSVPVEPNPVGTKVEEVIEEQK